MLERNPRDVIEQLIAAGEKHTLTPEQAARFNTDTLVVALQPLTNLAKPMVSASSYTNDEDLFNATCALHALTIGLESLVPVLGRETIHTIKAQLILGTLFA